MTNTIASQGDTLVLTKKEVEEAREANLEVGGCEGFLDFNADICSPGEENFAHCALCLKLTQFGEGGEDE